MSTNCVRVTIKKIYHYAFDQSWRPENCKYFPPAVLCCACRAGVAPQPLAACSGPRMEGDGGKIGAKTPKLVRGFSASASYSTHTAARIPRSTLPPNSKAKRLQARWSVGKTIFCVCNIVPVTQNILTWGLNENMFPIEEKYFNMTIIVFLKRTNW